MNKILNIKITSYLTKIIGEYNLPYLELIKNNNEINRKNAEWETKMIQFRLTHQDCYDIDDFYYDNLKNTKISKINMQYNFDSKALHYFWTIIKIS